MIGLPNPARAGCWLFWYLVYLVADRDHWLATRSADLRVRPRLRAPSARRALW